VSASAASTPARTAELIDLVATLGRERFAPRAARYDAEASFPFENYADLREAGLLALCIPERFGGMGADFQTYCLVAAEMGRWCGATALTYNMHAQSMLWSGEIADQLDMADDDRAAHERRREAFYGEVVEAGVLYAQPFSEPTASSATGAVTWDTEASETAEGWRVSGRKHFASLSGAADFYTVTATARREGAEPSRRDTVFLAVPADAEGFEITGVWDPVGMRATVSRNLVLDEVLVPHERQVLPPGVYFQAAVRWPHLFMTLCPTYMGIAQAAFDFTVAYLRGELEGGPSGPPRRSSATKQLAVAEMAVKLEAARALFERAVGEAHIDPDKAMMRRAYATQFTVMETANDICRLAVRTCGGSSIQKALPLERLYRDSRCGALMLPWNAEICLERLGRESLYERGETD